MGQTPNKYSGLALMKFVFSLLPGLNTMSNVNFLT
uniref:Uncharacterized protein n=1 Tax=Rhizophora mucronata TaxID=61149 RepID=A0A2P2MZ01_RHIMU